jgi:hypothetical protein
VFSQPVILQAKLSSLGRLEDRLDIKLSVAAELPGQMEGLARQQRAEAASMEGLRSEVRLLQAQLGKLERSQALAKSEAAVASLSPTQLSHVSRHRALAAADITSNSCGSSTQSTVYRCSASNRAAPWIQLAYGAGPLALIANCARWGLHAAHMTHFQPPATVRRKCARAGTVLLYQ